MKEYVGIWVDHKKVFIVSIAENQVTINNIVSNVDGHLRLSGGSRTSTPYGPQEGPSEGRREERRRQKLRQYYKKIIRIISDAEKIFIFGLGEAKTELMKEMEKSKDLSSRIVGAETTDKMTERQIKGEEIFYFKYIDASPQRISKQMAGVRHKSRKYSVSRPADASCISGLTF